MASSSSSSSSTNTPPSRSQPPDQFDMGTNNNSFDYSHNQHFQQPLTDSTGNYSNIIVTSSPLKNSNFHFNDDLQGFDGMIQNENININMNMNMKKSPNQDPSLQFLYQSPQQPIRQGQLQHPYVPQSLQQIQDGNETDEDKTDDESANVSATKTNINMQHPPRQHQQALQYPPNIQNYDGQFQQQQPIYHIQQGITQPQFVHPQNITMYPPPPLPQKQGYPMSQTNLYPAMEYFPSKIPESNSNNTISSYESAPFMISSSVSDNSIASPASFNISHNTTLMTPQRYSNTTGGGASERRTSITLTPIPFETPSRSHSFIVPSQSQSQQISTSPMHTRATPRRNTTASNTTANKSHRRSRSRLSVDPSGAAAIVTTLHHSLSEHRLSSITKSPSVNGTNPFYPHSSSLLSPHHPSGSRLTTSQSLNNLNSPTSTPLQTPGSLKRSHYLDEEEDDPKERLRKITSISPNMLMARSFLESVHDERDEEQVYQQQTHHKDDGGDDTQSDKSIKFDNTFESAQNITFPLANFTNLDMMNNTSFLCDPSNSDITNRSPLKSSPEKPLHKKKLLRSQSSINLKSYTNNDDPSQQISQYPRGEDLIKARNLGDHPLIDKSLKYDKPIVLGRKKLTKSSSTNSVNETSTLEPPKTKRGKPKKLHPCPLCDVILQRPEHVKRHMNSHSSEKPFVCEEPDCGVRFNRKDNLRAHIRNIHHMNI